jgi:hypothetical protein
MTRRAAVMDPEEMDVVELLADIAVEPAWRVRPDVTTATLRKGDRGMVVHKDEQAPLYDVEFVDGETKEPWALAKLRGDQIRVVERDLLGGA